MSDAALPADRMPEAPVHGGPATAHAHHVNYLAVFITLVILTGVTVGVALFLHIGVEWQKVLLALAIAFAKAALVVLYFMHMKFEGKLIYLILIVPVCFCVVLVLSLLPDIAFAPLMHDATFDAWRGAAAGGH